MNDKELCEAFGITLEEVETEVNKLEQGDYSSWDFSRAMLGSPIQNEKMEMVSAPIGKSRIEAMKRISKDKGISRSEFIRRAIDHELIAMS